MAPKPKRRKIDQPTPRGRCTAPSVPAKKAGDVMPTSGLKAPIAQINFRIQQAKNFAVSQAQQEGCTGNFRIFDSPFGNFLVPVVPTRTELAG